MFENYKKLYPPIDLKTYEGQVPTPMQGFDFKGDKEIGVAFMHTHSPYYRRIIQLAVLDDDQRELGNEVEVIFGEKGFRCKKIRAKVEQFPYNKHHERKGYSL